jgi:hypothetical protein
LWIRNRERFQDEGSDQREDGRVGADTESERQDCDGGEPEVPSQQAKAVAEVLKQDFDCGKRVPFPVGLFSPGNAAEAPQSDETGLLRRHALTEVFADFHLEMKLELFIQIMFHCPLAKETAETLQKHAQWRHDASPEGLRKRAMISEMRSQFSLSAASCFLPARVMV